MVTFLSILMALFISSSADNVTIHADSKTYIEKYTYNDVDYAPEEIIHIKKILFIQSFEEHQD